MKLASNVRSTLKFGLLVFTLVAMLAACRGGPEGIPSGEVPSQATPQPSAAQSFSQPTSFALALDPVAGGFSQPVYVTHAGDGSNRLFVVERQGTIRILAGGTPSREPFLDVRSLITASGQEQGLLGLAFHPRYRENGRFFIYYTARNGDNTVEEYRVSSDPNRAEPNPTARLLAIPDFAPNHNGGMLAFGRDGYLYVGTGDGGGAGDPQRTAQNRNHLLGKILRLDVDRGRPYAIPANNPFVNESDARPEVWAYGLRNPWRFSFDRQTGDLWIGDVGQNAIEEINLQQGNSRGGENYGWSNMEGTRCFRSSSGCETSGMVLPVTEYERSGGRCAVIGGYVYRGKASPAMTGAYFYGDNCSGQIWTLQSDQSGSWQSVERLDSNLLISAFGEDEAGEIYALDLTAGTVNRLSAAPR